VPHLDNETAMFVSQIYRRADAFLLGRRTYEIFAGSWGAMADPGDNPIAVALNITPKHVASTTLTDPQWANTTVISSAVAAAVGKLKAKPGRELQVHGSRTLIRTSGSIPRRLRASASPSIWDATRPARAGSLDTSATRSRSASASWETTRSRMRAAMACSVAAAREAADYCQLSRVVSCYGRLDQLLLDELGYVQVDPRGAELLFQIITEREERSSIGIGSNLPSR
jgi:dihydrofolate reductase